MEVKGYAANPAGYIRKAYTYGETGNYNYADDCKADVEGLERTTAVPCLVLTGEEMEWYLANKPKGEK